MALRSMVVHVGRPKAKAADWFTATRKLIDDTRTEIESNVRWMFNQPPASVKVDDFGEWGAEVLARCMNPAKSFKLLHTRARHADAQGYRTMNW